MFPAEFPQTALLEVFKAVQGKSDVPRMALAGYELLGYGLHQYFGDVKYPMTDPFEVIQAGTEAMQQYEKIAARAKELRAKGVGTILIILQLIMEFGPIVLQLVQKIRELLKK